MITVDRAARETDSDRRRIEATLGRLPAGSKARDMLEEYHNRLRLRVKRDEITLRSMRLALTPAAKLLEVAAARRRLPPDQGTLDAFLRDAPGQASALSGFVSYLRRVHGAELTMPKRRVLQRQRERRAKLLPELLAMMREVSTDRIVSKRWVQLALQYFHDLPACAGEKLAEGDLMTDAEGVTVRIDEQDYWIPVARASRGRLDSGLRTWQRRAGAVGARSPRKARERLTGRDGEHKFASRRPCGTCSMNDGTTGRLVGSASGASGSLGAAPSQTVYSALIDTPPGGRARTHQPMSTSPASASEPNALASELAETTGPPTKVAPQPDGGDRR